jgi:hypothetical protein
LSRSRSYPLWLDLGGIVIDSADHLLCATELLAALVLHRARWEHLNIFLSLSRLSAIEGPMPLLRSLKLRLSDDGEDYTTNVSFLEAPLLRTVVFNDAAAHNITLMPWTQLTSLTLHAVCPRDCAPILQLTPNLVHCELGLAGEDGIENGVNITLPSLRSLTLSSNVPVAGYLGTFILPTLRSLEISESYLDPDCIDTLASFVTKSRCKLQELCITDRASASEDSYRKAFPSTSVSFDHEYYVRVF